MVSSNNRYVLKCTVFLVLISFFLPKIGNSQVKMGARGGISFKITDYQQTDASEPIPERFSDIAFGVHGGLFLRAKLGPIFLQPEIMLTSLKDIDIPILVGFKLGPARINAGPFARMAFDRNEGILNPADETRLWPSAAFGFQAGAGIDLLKMLTLDLRYEGGLQFIGDDISLFGNTHSLNSGPSQIVLSAGILF